VGHVLSEQSRRSRAGVPTWAWAAPCRIGRQDRDDVPECLASRQRRSHLGHLDRHVQMGMRIPRTVACRANRSKLRPTCIQPSGFSFSATNTARPADDRSCLAYFLFSASFLKTRSKILAEPARRARIAEHFPRIRHRSPALRRIVADPLFNSQTKAGLPICALLPSCMSSSACFNLGRSVMTTTSTPALPQPFRVGAAQARTDLAVIL